jgi:zinc finger FYVE domain-containing protein 1
VWNETCAITDGVSGSDIKGRKVIDIINNVSETVGNLTQPAQELLADKVAPDYWVPNSEIKVCSVCNREFGGVIKTKHHCRACGKGVCDDCSSHSMAVSWRGWGNSPVRVCDNCYTTQSEATDTIVNSTTSGTECTTTTTTNSSDFTTATGTDVTATTATGSVSTRYIAENVNSAIGLVGGIFTYPKQALIETVRPSYWVPDDEIIHCSVCLVEFTSSIDSYKHHCRSCGEGVCDKCSQQRKPVPSKGWDYPVRVCDNCLTLLS